MLNRNLQYFSKDLMKYQMTISTILNCSIASSCVTCVLLLVLLSFSWCACQLYVLCFFFFVILLDDLCGLTSVKINIVVLWMTYKFCIF